MNDALVPKQRKLLALASQLKAGKGLAVASSIVKGEIPTFHFSFGKTFQPNLWKLTL